MANDVETGTAAPAGSRAGPGPGGPARRARRRVGAAGRALRRGIVAAERRLPAPVRRFARWLRGPEFLVTSSSLAFYALVSVPPMILIAVWLAGLVLSDAQLDALVTLVGRRAPQDVPAGPVTRELFALGAAAGPFSVLAAAWPATAYGGALGRAFTTVSQGEEHIRGWKGRILSLVVIALLPVAVVSAVALLYLGPRLLGTGPGFTAALVAGSVLVVWAVIAVIFGLFRLRDASAADVLLAAAATTALEVTVSGAYLLYLRLGADFTERYGRTSLATLVLLALWLLLANAALIAGYRLMIRRAVLRRGGGTGQR